MKRKSTIVVTGAAGFIGSCVVKELNSRGIDNIVLIDRLGEGKKWQNLVGKSFIDLIHKDKGFGWLRENANAVKAVIHLGACSSTVESNADYLLENNTHDSIEMAKLSYKHSWRFIYASSAATYGSGKGGFDDNVEQLERLEPLNMYGYSKHLFDLWLRRNKLIDRFVGLKYFNVYGPNEWHKGRMSSHVLKMVEQVKEGRIKLFKSSDPSYADGGQMRDFIYVKDVARMTCDLLDNTHAGIFNIGFGRAHSWNDLAFAVIRALGTKATIEYIDMPSDLIGQYQNYTCANMQRWENAGLEACRYSLEEGVQDYIQNHLLPSKTW